MDELIELVKKAKIIRENEKRKKEEKNKENNKKRKEKLIEMIQTLRKELGLKKIDVTEYTFLFEHEDKQVSMGYMDTYIVVQTYKTLENENEEYLLGTLYDINKKEFKELYNQIAKILQYQIYVIDEGTLEKSLEKAITKLQGNEPEKVEYL